MDVVFVTGRPPRWLPPIAEVTGHRGLAVCANGALVVDLDDVRRRPRHRRCRRRRCWRWPTGCGPGSTAPAFALETLDGVRREPQFMPRHEHALAARTGTLPELLADRPTVV